MISPSNSSLWPSPSAHAVSKKLQPASIAVCIAASDSLSSEPLHPLMPQRPCALSLTSNPVRPNFRYFIDVSSLVCATGLIHHVMLRRHHGPASEIVRGGISAKIGTAGL